MSSALFPFTGLPDEVYEKLKQGTYSLEFSKNGDTWSYEVVSSILPTKTYTFQPGIEVNTTDLFGKASKVSYNILLPTRS